MRFPPKQPTVPLMPRTSQPNNKRHLDENTPLILDNKVIGVCKKLGSGYVECVIWDRNLTYEYLAENYCDNPVIVTVNIKHHKGNDNEV